MRPHRGDADIELCRDLAIAEALANQAEDTPFRWRENVWVWGPATPTSLWDSWHAETLRRCSTNYLVIREGAHDGPIVPAGRLGSRQARVRPRDGGLNATETET